MTATLQWMKTARPCRRCVVPAEKRNSNERFQARNIDDPKEARHAYEQLLKGARVMNTYTVREPSKEAELLLLTNSLSSIPSFLETTPLLPHHNGIDLYSIFSFEPLHNLHLGISKDIKRMIFERLSTEDLQDARGNLFKFIRKSVVQWANAFLALLEKEYPTSCLHVEFSKAKTSTRLDGLFVEDRVRGMLEGKDYKTVDMIFPFIAAFIDRACGEVSNGPVTTVSVLYLDLVGFFT